MIEYSKELLEQRIKEIKGYAKKEKLCGVGMLALIILEAMLKDYDRERS